MTTDPQTGLRTRPDGSIDMAHYTARGRLARSRTAHGILGAIVRRLRVRPRPQPLARRTFPAR